MRSHIVGLMMAALIAAGPMTAQQQSGEDRRRAYAISGTVTDSVDRPVFGAEIVLEAGGGAILSVRSRRDGRFVFPTVARGATAIRVRRLGFHPYEVLLPVQLHDATLELTIVLRAAVVDVAPVVVAERANVERRHLREFYEHKRTSRFGHFLERDEIARRDPTFISEMFRSLRGVDVVSDGSVIGNRVRVRGCRPAVWLNGLRIVDAEVDEVAHPADVDAIEVYVSMIGMPARFVDMVGRCGAVAVWTSDGQATP